MMKRVRIPLTPRKGRGVPGALRAVPDRARGSVPEVPRARGRSKEVSGGFKGFQEVSFALTRVPKILKKNKKSRT